MLNKVKSVLLRKYLDIKQYVSNGNMIYISNNSNNWYMLREQIIRVYNKSMLFA